MIRFQYSLNIGPFFVCYIQLTLKSELTKCMELKYPWIETPLELSYHITVGEE